MGSKQLSELVVSARTYFEKARTFVCAGQSDVAYAESAMKELRGIIENLESIGKETSNEIGGDLGIAGAALTFFSKSVETFKNSVKAAELKAKQEVANVKERKKALVEQAEKIKEEREARRANTTEKEEERKKAKSKK